MGFFDNLKGTLSSTGKEVSKKVNDTVSAAKLQSQVTASEKKISDLFSAIGKAYFEKFADAECADFAEEMASIKELKSSIEQLKDQIDDIKGIQRCPVCGAELAKDAQFCNKCGAQIPEKTVEEVVEEAAEQAQEVCEEAAEQVQEACEEAAEEVKEAAEQLF